MQRRKFAVDLGQDGYLAFAPEHQDTVACSWIVDWSNGTESKKLNVSGPKHMKREPLTYLALLNLFTVDRKYVKAMTNYGMLALHPYRPPSMDSGHLFWAVFRDWKYTANVPTKEDVSDEELISFVISLLDAA